jgi:dienelactone hydrolase
MAPKGTSMKFRLLAIFSILTLANACPAMTPDERESYRQMLLLNLPSVPSFDQWMLRTRELPPDFDALPRHNGLPDPLTFLDGKPVKTAADWKARREEILRLYQKYVWGTVPPHAPLDHADVQDSPGAAYRTRTGTLYAGPGGKGTIRFTLQIPNGTGPFPVVMGPSLVGGLGGGARAGGMRGATGPAAGTAPAAGGAARGPTAGGTAGTILDHGYIVASFSANDAGDDSANLGALYPDADFGTLPRRGWAASVVVDYLLTLPEVDPKHIAITGYSRDGKSSTIGAALDERIAAVIAGSPGVGGILPFRLASEINQAESIQSTTLMFPDWFPPRLRYFAGREDRLPVDGNLLLAAIAPRPFFLVAGQNDEVSNDYGDEQSFHSAQKAYDLLGAGDKLGILRVPGYHGANDWEQAMTFLDIQFGRSDKKWTNQWIFPWDYEQWKKTTGETVDLAKYPARKGADLLAGAAGGVITTTQGWEAKAAQVRKNMEWMLGDATPAANPKLTPSALPDNPPDVAAWVIRRSIGGLPEFGWFAEDNVLAASRPVAFAGINGTLYYPRSAPAGAKLPTVIWLHSYSYPLGYMWVYHRDVLHPILALVENGYAVLAYDQFGFGSRMKDYASFYDRTPHGSLMGRMVADARAAVDVLGQDEAVDAKRIYLFGYGMGGNVALYTGALERRVAGVVSICGFTPMRTDTADTGTGGIARFSTDRPLLPRLGMFVGNESKIPYDYDEILGAIAPRPTYVANPLFDRDANSKDVHVVVESARKVYSLYQAEDKLRIDEPYDYDRLSSFLQDRILLWMRDNMK